MTNSAAPRHQARLLSWEKLPARLPLSAPPLRHVKGADGPAVTLHTFQTRVAYEALRREGVLVGDPMRAIPGFEEAYAWMSRQMDDCQVGEPGEGIVWLWANATHRQLRHSARECSGDVLLSVRVARDRVLVSDFDAWHDVLNRGLHLPRRVGESLEAWDARWDARDDAFRARADPYLDQPVASWPVELRTEIEASWEAIFVPETWPRRGYRQATMRALRAEDIIRAVRIR